MMARVLAGAAGYALAEPEAMKRVGEGAQREIYVSWESAVATAYERYGAVIENYRSGRCPTHDSPSDEFYHSMATYLEQRARRREAQRELLEEVRRSGSSLLSGVADQSRRLSEQLEKLYQYLDRFL